MKKFKHKELVNIAEKWLLRKNCGFVFKELSTFSFEIPDAIGFKSFESILIECKTSRNDFKNDSKKIFRKNPWMGVGKYRFYLCPKDIIKPEELPDKWGLLYVSDKGVVRQKVGPKGNIWNSNNDFIFNERNLQNETQLMYSALRRLHLQGVIDKIYDSPWKKERKMKEIGKGPACFKVFKSGWTDMYHLIYENPENGDYDHEHHFLSKEKMIKYYPFTKK